MDTTTTCFNNLRTASLVSAGINADRIAFQTADGVTLHGHYWISHRRPIAAVIINAATGVLARYYHRYAQFLAQQGFNVLTYDYRGIGESRPEHLKRCTYRWREWGEFDFSAALRVLQDRNDLPIHVVGHSIGGILPGLASNAAGIDRMLTIGAQYAWWRDYASAHRRRLFWKWHIVMPLLTSVIGYFPGKRLGWLEDLPKGVANEWSFRGPRLERSFPAWQRETVLEHFRAVRSDILAIVVADDEYAPRPAVYRGLSYFENSARTVVELRPEDEGVDRIGHFELFHSRHRDCFWRATADWLATGVNPWPRRAVLRADASDAYARGRALSSLPVAATGLVSGRRVEKKQLRYLVELDDHLLSDVGLTRDQVRCHMRDRGIASAAGTSGLSSAWPRDSFW